MKLIKEGRVKDVYRLDSKTQIIVSKDKIALDNVVLEGSIPQKGIIVNKLLEFWGDYIKEIIPNNFITTNNKDLPTEFQQFTNRCMLVEKVEVLPVHAVVRGYLTGSAWEQYKNSAKICDIILPEGMEKNERLSPVYTPKIRLKSMKSKLISFEKSIKLLGSETAEEVKDVALKVYSVASEYALSKGLVIADTKLKFGIDVQGQLVFLDGLTPDNSRIWSALDFARYDKRFIVGHVGEESKIMYSKYYDVYRMLTGKTVI